MSCNQVELQEEAEADAREAYLSAALRQLSTLAARRGPHEEPERLTTGDGWA